VPEYPSVVVPPASGICLTPRDFTRVHAIHPHWDGFLRLFHADGAVLLEGFLTQGDYRLSNGILTVFWETYRPDTFVQRDGIYLHETLCRGAVAETPETAADEGAGPAVFHAVSRLTGSACARETMLLPSSEIPKTFPKLGTVLYDDPCAFIRLREYLPIAATFPEVYAWHIESPILTDCIVVHRDRDVFVDSSIFSADSDGQKNSEILAAFSAKINLYGRTVEDFYETESAMMFHNEGSLTWGHFVVQNLPRALLYLQRFPDGKLVLPRFLLDPNENYIQLLKKLGVSVSQIIPVDAEKSYRFRELVLVDFLYDFGRQIPRPPTLALLSPHRRERPDVALSGAVFIERTSWTGRAIANQIEIDALLERYEIPKVSLGELPLEKQLDVWSRSKLIIATLGSDLTNILFASPGVRLLVLSPHWFHDNFFYHLAVLLGLQWNELRCGTEVETKPHHKSPFCVDPVRLEVLLASLMA
jgi:hypothetical protein